jgi:hypothetical protein
VSKLVSLRHGILEIGSNKRNKLSVSGKQPQVID